MAGDNGEMFAATKGAVMAFSRSLAQTLAPEVRVNCLAPGWIRTRWAESATEVWQQRACRESLLSRWGTPEDVARAAHFLASPAGAFVTGQVIQVNGGGETLGGMTGQHIHFVTGRLAEHALRQTLEPLAKEEGFTYSVDVLPISVAALMTPRWIAARLNVPESQTGSAPRADRV